jgi:peptidoglycan/xylan/chitin deacetylase (PgdA/CDA1 family)
MGLNHLKVMFLRHLIYNISFSLIKQIGANRPTILYYHVVNDNTVPHISHLYNYKNTRQFCADIEFLLKHYFPIGLADIIDFLQGKKKLPLNCFLLTFDDGFREIFDVIAPILLDKGISATFFISSAFLDNQELCYRQKASLLIEMICKGVSVSTEADIKGILVESGLHFLQLSEGLLKVDYRRKEVLDRIAEILRFDFQNYLNEQTPYLTSVQIKKLIDWGFTIGAHSIDHPNYYALSLAEQLQQTKVSVKKIREKFGLNYGAFAFPHNDTGVSLEFFKNVQDSGLVDITFGTNGLMDSFLQNHLQRISLDDPSQSAKDLITWQYVRWLYKKII